MSDCALKIISFHNCEKILMFVYIPLVVAVAEGRFVFYTGHVFLTGDSFVCLVAAACRCKEIG